MGRPTIASKTARVVFALGFAVFVGFASYASSTDTCGRLSPNDLTTADIQSFRDRTLIAVDSLRLISESLQSDRGEIAEEVLAQATESWCELETTSEYFRLIADQQSDQCQSRVAELLDRLAFLYQNQQGLEKTLGELRAGLAEAALDDQMTSEETLRLRQSIEANKRDLAERQLRLKELRDWWWVPGYGLYLKIRDAVNLDEIRSQTLIMELDDMQRRFDDRSAKVSDLRALQARLTTDSETASFSGDKLNQMQIDLVGKLGARKGSVVFFVEARSFWNQVQRINLENVGDSLRFIQELQNDLGNEASASLLGEEKSTLKAELERFATTVDTNSVFLFSDEFDLCPNDVVIECKPGYVVDDGFCWSQCPQGFEMRDKVCVKPPSFDLVGQRGDGQYQEMVQLQQDVANLLAEIRQLDRELIAARGRKVYEIQDLREERYAEALAVADGAVSICRSVYQGQGTCSPTADRLGLQINCRPQFTRTEVPVMPDLPPAGQKWTVDDLQRAVLAPSYWPKKTVCVPQCPPEMADLGSTCGRVFYTP